MTAAHTPGHWSVSELDATGEISEYHIFIEPGIAVIERKVAGHDQHDMADALVLAAAKDLLTALQDILKVATVRIDDPRIAQWDAARAAITKAGAASS